MAKCVIIFSGEKERLTCIFIHVEGFDILEWDLSILVILDEFLVAAQGCASWKQEKAYKAKVESQDLGYIPKWRPPYYSSIFQRKLCYFLLH